MRFYFFLSNHRTSKIHFTIFLYLIYITIDILPLICTYKVGIFYNLNRTLHKITMYLIDF